MSNMQSLTMYRPAVDYYGHTRIPRMPAYNLRNMKEFLHEIKSHVETLIETDLEGDTNWRSVLKEIDNDLFNFNTSHIVYLAYRLGYYSGYVHSTYLELQIPEWLNVRNP